jgi:capsular polysaccharide biosynthesis protein
MEQKQNINEEVEIDLRELLELLWRKAIIIILAGIVFALAALMISKFIIQPQYQSTTKVYIINRQTQSTITYSDLQSGTQLTKDYMELVKSRPVTEQVIQELGLDMTHEELCTHISVETPSDTRILKITVTDYDPYMARDVANAIREAAAVHISTVMDIESVNVVEEANLPEVPSSPNIMRNTIIAAILGIFLAVGLILLIHTLDDTIKTPEEVEKYLGLSVLASIPQVEMEGTPGKKKKKKPDKIDNKKIFEEKIQKISEEV